MFHEKILNEKRTILQEQDKYEFLNDVNADDINKMDVNVKTLDRREMYPASSDFVGEWSVVTPDQGRSSSIQVSPLSGIKSMLDHNSLTPPMVPFSGLGELYSRDTQQCLQK